MYVNWNVIIFLPSIVVRIWFYFGGIIIIIIKVCMYKYLRFRSNEIGFYFKVGLAKKKNNLELFGYH